MSTELQVAADSEAQPIEAVDFSLVPESMKKDLEPLFKWQQRALDAASAASSSGALAGAVHGSAGIFKPINGSELQQKADGTWTTVIRDENGKITKHVPLEKQNPLVGAAQMGWAMTNVVVGQAHMMNIAEQLANINKTLDDIKDFLHDQQISKVESAIESWGNIDFGKPDAASMIHHDRGRLDEACRNIYKAIQHEIAAMPDAANVGFFENWGGRKSQKTVIAEEHYKKIMRLMPVYIRGMLFLAITDGYENGGNASTISRFTENLDNLLSQSGFTQKVKLVPSLGGVSPAKLVGNLAAANKESNARFQQMQARLADRAPIFISTDLLHKKEMRHG